MSEEKRFKISFDQSVSSGIIGFHGTVEFGEHAIGGTDIASTELRVMLTTMEETFKKAGYNIASDIKPKEPKK